MKKTTSKTSSKRPPSKKLPKICVVGLGYIGLPTAAVFADKGYQVHGYDVSMRAVNAVRKGSVHIVEPDLEQVVSRVVRAKKLVASNKPDMADYFLITVPTPVEEKNHKPDLSYIFAASDAIAPYLKPGDMVVLESTSPVGTTEKLAKYLVKKRKDLKGKLGFAYCPERVLPGKILYELTHNDRIVGGLDDKATKRAKALYQSLTKGEVLATSAKTAEMVKLSENAFRDVNIAYANELSLVADKLGVNVAEVIRCANHHPRVNILQPGPGVGGHCIAVDPWFLIDSAPKQSPLMRTAREVNDGKRDWVVDQVRKAAKKITGRKPRITCLGIAFKPDIDDIRESPSLYVTEKIIAKKFGKITVVEPHLDKKPAPLTGAQFTQKLTKELLSNTDILVVLVKHSAFVKAARLIRNYDGQLIDSCGLLA